MKIRFSAALSSAALVVGMLVNTACAKENTSAQATSQPVQNAVASASDLVLAKTSRADWRALDQENSLYITTEYGLFIVELAPEMAPLHVTQIKTLAREKFYDDITFHRVIDGFMNQTGDPKGDGTGDSALPDIKAEFTIRRTVDMPFTPIGRALSKQGEVETGFFKSLPLASKPIGQAMLTKDGKVDAWGLHCKGTTSMARGGNDVNSGNSQFFLMRAEYPTLNQLYSIWGMTVWGRGDLTKMKVGTAGETKNFIPDLMKTVRIGADLPKSEQKQVQILKTDSKAFQAYLNTLKTTQGKLPSICDITVPSRLQP